MRRAGLVLCGGQSQRMGRPKAWLPFGDELLLVRVVRLLREAVEPVVVVAAGGQDVPALPAEVRIVRDRVQGRGPLAGLAAGLAALRDEADAVYVSSTDSPFLARAFVTRMFDLLGEHAICVPYVEGDFHARIGQDPIYVPNMEGRFHPLAAVYRTELATVAEALVAEGQLRPVFLFEKVPTRVVEAAELRDIDPDLNSLRNLNTEEEYRAALRDWKP